MSLGERIKNERNKNGLSQEKVAERVGVSRQAVTKWETGQSAPSTANLITLSDVFGVSLGELISGVGENAPIEAAIEPDIPVKQGKGAWFLIFAGICLFFGAMVIAIINNMNAIEIIRIFNVSFTFINTVRLVITLLGVKLVGMGIALFVLYVLSRRSK